MSLNRREFLLLAGASAVAACDRGRSPAAADVVLGGGRFRQGPDAPLQYVLVRVDLGRRQKQTAPLDFFPHGIHPHPGDPGRLAVFQKIGPGACEFDLGEMRQRRRIEASEGHWFYGHGSYSADGRWLYCTEASRDTGDGRIVVRDSDSLAVAGLFPSYGRAPHECKLIDQGRTLVVTNGGGPSGGSAPCVSYIDVASQRLIESLEPSNPQLNTGHLVLAADGHLAVVSAPREGLEDGGLGGISLAPPGGHLCSIREPAALVEQMLGEALSAAIHAPSRTLAVTHPDGNLLSFWRLDSAEPLAHLRLDRPRGLALTRSGDAFIVSCGREAGLLRIDARSLKPDRDFLLNGSYITGSHLFSLAHHQSELGVPGAAVRGTEGQPRPQDQAPA